MSDSLPTPITRKEIYMAAALGLYTGELPTPITRAGKYLYRLATEGVSGSIDEEDLQDAIAAYVAENGVDGSFSELQAVPINHRNFYRGKYLGDSVTEAQQAAIADGTFDDLFVGDYWTIGGVNWRIADINYWLNCGDSNFATNHLVIVPDTCLGNVVMNSTSTTNGGYVGSALYTSGMDSAKNTITTAFGSLILTHREYLVDAVSNGHPSGAAWYDSDIDLMTETQLYGHNIFGAMSDGETIPINYTTSKQQFALFRLNPHAANIRLSYWLRDVVSGNAFAFMSSNGHASYADASLYRNIRPAFPIGVAD